MLWSVWLSRNELVFKNIRVSDSYLENIIKSNSYIWGVSNYILLPGDLQAWEFSPQGLLVRSSEYNKRKIVSFWLQITNLVAFIDGACKKDGLGQIKAGLGGYILGRPTSLLFTFSGPSNQVSPYSAELEALTYVLGQLSSSNYKEAQIAIFTDSKMLVDNFQKIRSSNDLVVQSRSKSNIVHNVNLIHIDRSINSEADRLAKEGMTRDLAWLRGFKYEM